MCVLNDMVIAWMSEQSNASAMFHKSDTTHAHTQTSNIKHHAHGFLQHFPSSNVTKTHSCSTQNAKADDTQLTQRHMGLAPSTVQHRKVTSDNHRPCWGTDARCRKRNNASANGRRTGSEIGSKSRSGSSSIRGSSQKPFKILLCQIVFTIKIGMVFSNKKGPNKKSKSGQQSTRQHKRLFIWV